tara:strand:+ start:826 stop:1071 length:246 start_codon:yes stop_codon:yes gene_type:complete
MEEEIKYLKDMMNSCFAYGGVDINHYYYKRYILPYKKILGKKLYTKIYEEHKNYLINTYSVEYNVYTDNDGLTYNSLKKIK